jgi:hypothetical protein
VSPTEERNRQLGESFRQSRREMFVILVAWLVFAAWTGLVCGIGSRLDLEEPMRMTMGMPSWVFFGVVVPWLAACLFTFWLAGRFMKDTELDPDRDRPGRNR